MASKNLYYTIKSTGTNFDLKKAVSTAIRNNAIEYLNPPITNIAYKGILKTSAEIIKWFNTSKDIEKNLHYLQCLWKELEQVVPCSEIYTGIF